MNEPGRYRGMIVDDPVVEVDDDFSRLESSFFDTGAGIERGEVAPPDEPAHQEARRRPAWRRLGGLLAGAGVALVIVAVLLATNANNATAVGQETAEQATALAQSPRR
jgi:ferric-dicitrate binding protein FerR (iron transport regulator)